MMSLLDLLLRLEDHGAVFYVSRWGNLSYVFSPPGAPADLVAALDQHEPMLVSMLPRRREIVFGEPGVSMTFQKGGK